MDKYRQYKRYLEPNCEPEARIIPRKTKYRKNHQTNKHSSIADKSQGKRTSSTFCEGAHFDSRDADGECGDDVEAFGILQDVQNGGKEPEFFSTTDSGEDKDLSISDGFHQNKDLYNGGEEPEFFSTTDSGEDKDLSKSDGFHQNEDLYNLGEEPEHTDIIENDDENVWITEDSQLNEDMFDEGEENISTSKNEEGENFFKYDGFQQNEDLDEKHEIKISVSKKDILTLILAFALRYQVPDTAIVNLIEMVNIILGNQFITPSLFKFWKVFNYDKFNIVKTHFFCERCNTYLCNSNERKLIICTTCGSEVQTGNAQKSSCFISLSLEHQIKNMICSGVLNMPYIQTFNKSKNQQNLYSDINDGKMYRKLGKKNESMFITYNFSVDGMAIFNNAKGTLWPILVTINEIPPTIRFKNVLLAGIWFGKKEPKMEVYMKPFVEEAINLAENGISLAPDSKYTLKAFAACCCADSVARPCIQNSMQYNGYYGCSWCKHPGFNVNGTVKYIYRDHLLYTERSEGETIKLMQEAMSVEKSILGVKGPSALLPVPFFNVISNFTPDYMHGIFLGVTKSLVLAWFDSRNNSRDFYIGSPGVCNIVNDRMSKIIFPRNVGRVPRTLHEKTLYKACEWKNFLLYMCLPCLNGILNKSYLDHISLLVGAVEILMRESINATNLKIADALILKFVTETQVLYGEEFMTFNMHLLLHFTTSVVNWGPLWCHSMFVYEGYNATLQSFIIGTRGIKTQAVKRYLLQQELISNKDNYPSEVSNFILNINSKSKLHQKFFAVDNCKLFGLPCMHLKDICNVNFPSGFLLENSFLENANINYFKRMTIDNMLFTIKSDKQYRTCDSLIYTGTEIGKIVFIALCRSTSEILICVNKYEFVKKVSNNVDNMYLMKNSNIFLIINIKDIIGKCVEYVDDDGLITISKVPLSFDLPT